MKPRRRITFLCFALLAFAAACSSTVLVEEPPPSASSGGTVTVPPSGTGGAGAGPTGTSSSASSSSSTGAGGSLGCTGAGDTHILQAGDIWPILYACGQQYITAEPGLIDCIGQKSGLTIDCAACFDAYVTCTIQHCLSECISDPKADTCVTCRQQQCDAVFLACSGLPQAP